jgi:hypothetical protein
VADVFISYARTDAAWATAIAAEIERRGLSVWYDTTGLTAGGEFASEIERQLDAAKAVLVLWSRTSARSEWVRDEADHAKRSGKLVSVLIDGLDLPPIGFRQRHAPSLSSVRELASEHLMRPVIQRLADLAEASGAPTPSMPKSVARSGPRPPRPDAADPTDAIHAAPSEAPSDRPRRSAWRLVVGWVTGAFAAILGLGVGGLFVLDLAILRTSFSWSDRAFAAADAITAVCALFGGFDLALRRRPSVRLFVASWPTAVASLGTVIVRFSGEPPVDAEPVQQTGVITASLAAGAIWLLFVLVAHNLARQPPVSR